MQVVKGHFSQSFKELQRCTSMYLSLRLAIIPQAPYWIDLWEQSVKVARIQPVHLVWDSPSERVLSLALEPPGIHYSMVFSLLVIG